MLLWCFPENTELFMSSTENTKKSSKYSDAIRVKLNEELISRSSGAAPGFFMVAAWITYHQFKTLEFKNIIIALGICLMLLACSRYVISELTKKNKILLSNAAFLLKINIIVNAILWSTALLLPLIELELGNLISTTNFVAIILGLTLTSLVTLTQYLYIALSYQWIMLLPNIIYLFYLAASKGNEGAFHIAMILSIGTLYLFKQTRDVHRDTFRRLKYSLELENTNQLLHESQKLLIKETAKLQHSTRLATLGEISGELAHEINNPLGIVQGNIELSLMSIESDTYKIDQIKGKLEKSIASINRITKIIKGLRYLSRQTENEPYLPCMINDIITETLDFCSEKFNFNKIEILYDGNEPHEITCRAIEISQVLLNLFTNAIDALNKVPHEHRHINIKVSEANKYVRITISNSGEKIPAEIEDKLFQSFFSTKEAGKGMGLGLSISKSIVEAHKGRLYYDPRASETTFVIELPKK